METAGTLRALTDDRRYGIEIRPAGESVPGMDSEDGWSLGIDSYQRMPDMPATIDCGLSRRGLTESKEHVFSKTLATSFNAENLRPDHEHCRTHPAG